MDKEDWESLRIFNPYAFSKVQALEEHKRNFVHYTTSANGLNILDGQCLWLRNSRLMNDYSEVRHGVDCLKHALSKPIGTTFRHLLNELAPGCAALVEDNFDKDLAELVDDSYLASISEHDPAEDNIGRLSMWRAYGGVSGLAFIFNRTPFVGTSSALGNGIVASPVLYADKHSYIEHFSRLVESLDGAIEYIRSIPQSLLPAIITEVLRTAVLSTKHSGFQEEKEWRIIYTPSKQTPDKKERLPAKIVTVAGIPQHIYEVPFCNYPEEGFVGATIPELIERVIIGPTEHSWPIWKAYLEKLEALGVVDAHDKLIRSDIPLRHYGR